MGLRWRGRLRLHRDRDAGDPPSDDVGCLDRGRAGPGRRAWTSNCRGRISSGRRCWRPWRTAGSTSDTWTGPSRPILRMKVRLGLFETPYLDIPGAGGARGARRRGGPGGPGPRGALARADPQRGAPAARSGHRAHRGHRARSPTALATCWATTATWATWRRSARCGLVTTPSGCPATRQSVVVMDEVTGRRDHPRRDPDAVRGQRRRARGRRPASSTRRTSEIAEAVEAARAADVAIVVLGERSGPDLGRHQRRVPRSARPRASSGASRRSSKPSSRPGRRWSSSS